MPTLANLTIRLATSQDAAAISQLVLASFDKKVARDWSASACAVFHAEMAEAPMRNILDEACLSLVAEIQGTMVGMLVLKMPTLLSMLFVSPQYIRQGIGRALWLATQDWLRANQPSVQTVELNASFGAVDFYRAVGFWPISLPYSMQGANAVRMACWLPGLCLTAAK